VAGTCGQTRCLAACRANRGTGRIFGPGVRIFDTSGRTQRPVGWSKRAAAPRYGDRHDVRYTDRERSTSNVQRSTFKGLTERAHGGRDMGTDTMLRYTDRERSTSNVQRSTFKGLTERAHGGRDMGAGPMFGRPDFWPGEPVQARVGRSRPAAVPR